jgi:uncharacterized protein
MYSSFSPLAGSNTRRVQTGNDPVNNDRGGHAAWIQKVAVLRRAIRKSYPSDHEEDGMNVLLTSREDVLAILKTFKDLRADEYALRSLGVFGSFARGEATEQSDVDVVFETDVPNLFRTARMRQELETLLARHVDVIRLRPNMNPHMRERILREARYV